jgi:hypothetical protein
VAARFFSSFGILALLWSLAAVPVHGDSMAVDLANIDTTTFSYLRIADHDQLEPQTLTIEAIITPTGDGYGHTTDPNGGVVIAKPYEDQVGSWLSSYGISWVPSDQLILGYVSHDLYNSGTYLYSTTGSVPLSGTTHVAMTFDGSTLRLYIDGELDNEEVASSSTVDYDSQDVLIGAANYGSGYERRYDGIVDEVRIWNRALSQAEIASRVDCLVNPSEPGLLAAYSFDASDATDVTGNGHNGTVVGAATFVESSVGIGLCGLIFADDFESGGLSAWDSAAR